MTEEFRLLFYVVVAFALVISGAWAAWRLFFAKRTPSAAPAAPAASSTELLHVERAAGGRVRIRLNGQDVGGANEIGDPKLRTAVRLLVSAVGGGEADALMPDVAAVRPAPAPIVPDDDMRRPLVERVRESLAKPQAYAQVPASRKPDASAVEEPAWMFAGINEIVQRLRAKAPDLADIELSGEGAEIRVWFDGKAYRGVDEVPDERARTLIREAIAQWERE